MIKPTEKIDKGAKQLQLCKVGWGQISSCPGGTQSMGGWASSAELMTYTGSKQEGGGAPPTFFPQGLGQWLSEPSPHSCHSSAPSLPDTPLHLGSVPLLTGAPFTHSISATALALVIIRCDLQRKC